MSYCPLMWIIYIGLYILLAAEAPFQLWHCSSQWADLTMAEMTVWAPAWFAPPKGSPASERSCQHAQLTSLVAENWVWSLSRIRHNETSTGTTLKSTFTQSTARSGACWTCHSQCSQTLFCTATLSQWKGTRWWATLGISQCYVKCFFS